jgi:hypothetical protein
MIKVIGVGVERLADQPLALPVGVSGVDEVDAQLDRPAEEAMTLRGAFGLPSRSGDSHGTEPEPVDRDLPLEPDLAGEPGQGLTLSCYRFRR